MLDIYVRTWKHVTDDIKSWIDTLADNGWLIINVGLGIPDEAKTKNSRVLTNAARKYGK